ncbi:MAG: AbrB/MazE/SpoVT family DNA-binding domain-containing protein [Terracidiphilus sp.]|jgi:AbrB family looped-hinge helix DNA binding protein
MTETVTLGESGRIVLPAAIRKKFGLKPGERLTVVADQGEIRLFSRDMILEQIRARILEKRGTLEGLLDEFLEERHEEARHEAAGE